MKLASIPFHKQPIATKLYQTRQNTLDLLSIIDHSFFSHQAHPEFSPIGWHFGHIAFTEAYWILEYLGGYAPLFPEYQRLFSADGLPKQERQHLPSMMVIKDYLQAVRAKVFNYLKIAPVAKQERLWRWLIQHESQHSETITFIWQLHQQTHDLRHNIINFSHSTSQFGSQSLTNEMAKLDAMVKVEAGEFVMGNNAIQALDNECPAHLVHLDDYWIDRYPVTCGQYYQFIAAGGYQKRHYWSDKGWQWLQQNPVSQPLFWSDNLDWIDHPVCGVSYYEAEAYAKFKHKRLPTEAEWEKAATGASLNSNHRRLIGHTSSVDAYPDSSKYGCRDMLGNVWEWTASWFAAYPDFRNYPYPNYSEVYFDNQHRVLRGGSWATDNSVLRTTFRNWYYPEVRQIFAGFRCVTDR